MTATTRRRASSWSRPDSAGLGSLEGPRGSAIEEVRAADSLVLSGSAIGVKAMLRGEPSVFELRPLSRETVGRR
jgi:hypothetical protein